MLGCEFNNSGHKYLLRCQNKLFNQLLFQYFILTIRANQSDPHYNQTVFLDRMKAIDPVNFEILLTESHHYGFHVIIRVNPPSKVDRNTYHKSTRDVVKFPKTSQFIEQLISKYFKINFLIN